MQVWIASSITLILSLTSIAIHGEEPTTSTNEDRKFASIEESCTTALRSREHPQLIKTFTETVSGQKKALVKNRACEMSFQRCQSYMMNKGYFLGQCLLR